MKKTRVLFCLLLSLILAGTILGCQPATGTTTTTAGTSSTTAPSTTEATTTTVAAEPVELPLLYSNAGNDSGYQLLTFFIDKFNSENEGKYKIVVEWLPGMAEDIRAKLKMLNASNDLPALVNHLGAEPAFAEMLIKNNRLMDIKPYFDASPEWQANCIPESIAYNTTADGKMFTIPSTSASYIGMFYNMAHFKDAGYDEFPTTWDDFWAACDALKAAGHTPISLHTTETGWCPMLVATSSLATSQAGMDFINQKYPTDFNVPAFIKAMEDLNRLFGYSTADAVGGKYALAANNFCAGITSMIPNGPWMIASLSDPEFSPEGFDKIVGYAPFPGMVMLSDQGLSYGHGVSMDHPLEVREGTVEWLKFLSREDNIRKSAVVSGGFSQKVPLTAEDLAELTPPMQAYANAIAKVEKTVPIYQNQWDPITQNEVIPADLPSLIMGDITVEEFCSKMSDAGKRYAEENNG